MPMPAKRSTPSARRPSCSTAIATPTPERVFEMGELLRRGADPDEISTATGVDPWFVDQMLAVVDERAALEAAGSPRQLSRRAWKRAKQLGFADAQLAWLWGTGEAEVRAARLEAGVRATFKTVDTWRRRVRCPHAVPLLHLRGRGRDPPRHPPPHDHPGLGTQPHRPGHRVRLLLRARQLRPARRRLRDRHGQLQPPRRFPPITTPPIACISSRSPPKTSSTSSTPRIRSASS